MSPHRLLSVATLVMTAVAQPQGECINEIIGLAQAAGIIDEPTCQLLADFELCVSQVSDAQQRTSLEVELQQKQSQYRDCSGEPLTAAIRTSRNNIDFQGGDFTFHRTTRQSLNLYEMRDQVAAFADDVSTTVTSIEAVQSTITVMDTGGLAQDATISAIQATVATIQQNMSLRLASLESRIDQTSSQIAAASSTTPCIPYVEYTASDGSCVQLNRTCGSYNRVEHFERARPTRTSDRVCTPRQVCTSSQWSSFPGNAFEDRACAAVTNCTAINQYHSARATATSDAVCVNLPGTSRSTAIARCNVLVSNDAAVSGFYWINTGGGGGTRQTYCDMDHEGGGWTMIARGRGGQLSCWRGQDCNLGNSGESHNPINGSTWKWSDQVINSLSYTRIRFSGHGIVQGNQYWRGRNNPGGGCTYRHSVPANGACNCASVNVNMASQRCGRAHSSHLGVGDWPNNGGMHSLHGNGNWYFKKHANHGAHGSAEGYCGGNIAGCNIAMWVR